MRTAMPEGSSDGATRLETRRGKRSGGLSRWLRAGVVAVFAAVAGTAHAGPVYGPVKVIELRPYGGSDFAYLVTDNPYGTFCSQSWYSINMASTGGKQMFAVALAALLSGKKVQLELAGACGSGPATSNPLQSIYIYP